jgi:hypothetical protein
MRDNSYRFSYFTLEPLGMSSGTVASVSLSPSVAARIMPWDSSPLKFTGLRLVTQITFLPMSLHERHSDL